jgi:hypothetical protein
MMTKLRTFTISRITLCAFTVALTVQCSYGESLPFRDSFTDGSPDDGLPVTWLPWQGSVIQSEDGNLVVQAGAGAVSSAEVRDVFLADISLRTELKLTSGKAAFVYIRSQSLPGAANGYAAVINANGRVFIAYDGTGEILKEAQTDFDPTADFLSLQLDAIDDEVNLWIWPPTEDLPEQPLLSVPDQSGFEGWVGVGLLANDTSESSAAFRYVHVGHSTIVLGDFDGNGILDASDIDALAIDTANDLFDLDDDGDVDRNDRDIWVEDLRRTWYGDANLDGVFNSSDLVAVLAAGEYDDDIPLNSGWATGDWDGNRDFTTSDLVDALADGGYEQGPRVTAAAVPEPSSVATLLVGLIAVATVRKTRRRRF